MFGLSVLVFLSFAACLYLISMAKEPSEPNCFSRFDYDEKLLLKVLHVQEEVNKFKTFVSELKGKQDDEDRKRVELMQTFLKDAKAELNLEVQRVHNLTQATESVKQEVIEKTQAAVDEIRKNWLILKNENDVAVAFTVKNPSDAANDVITFTDIVTNEGGGYNTATGKFTCSIPGWYYFIAHLVKARKSERVDSTGCYINKNTESLVKLFIDPGDTNADIGSYGVGNSVFVHLNEGDTVFNTKIGSRSSSTMDEQSSFSGFLVRLT